jgi:hypothetical protein
MLDLRRRQFLLLLAGGAPAWPLAARAQQPGRLPAIGVLGVGTPSGWVYFTGAFVSDCANSDGSRGVPSQSSIAGRRDTESISARSQPNSSGSR